MHSALVANVAGARNCGAATLFAGCALRSLRGSGRNATPIASRPLRRAVAVRGDSPSPAKAACRPAPCPTSPRLRPPTRPRRYTRKTASQPACRCAGKLWKRCSSQQRSIMRHPKCGALPTQAATAPLRATRKRCSDTASHLQAGAAHGGERLLQSGDIRTTTDIGTRQTRKSAHSLEDAAEIPAVLRRWLLVNTCVRTAARSRAWRHVAPSRSRCLHDSRQDHCARRARSAADKMQGTGTRSAPG